MKQCRNHVYFSTSLFSKSFILFENGELKEEKKLLSRKRHIYENQVIPQKYLISLFLKFRKCYPCSPNSTVTILFPINLSCRIYSPCIVLLSLQ